MSQIKKNDRVLCIGSTYYNKVLGKVGTVTGGTESYSLVQFDDFPGDEGCYMVAKKHLKKLPEIKVGNLVKYRGIYGEKEGVVEQINNEGTWCMVNCGDLFAYTPVTSLAEASDKEVTVSNYLHEMDRVMCVGPMSENHNKTGTVISILDHPWLVVKYDGDDPRGHFTHVTDLIKVCGPVKGKNEGGSKVYQAMLYGEGDDDTVLYTTTSYDEAREVAEKHTFDTGDSTYVCEVLKSFRRTCSVEEIDVTEGMNDE